MWVINYHDEVLDLRQRAKPVAVLSDGEEMVKRVVEGGHVRERGLI